MLFVDFKHEALCFLHNDTSRKIALTCPSVGQGTCLASIIPDVNSRLYPAQRKVKPEITPTRKIPDPVAPLVKKRFA